MSKFYENNTRPQKRSFIKAFKAWRGMLKSIRAGDNKKRFDYVLEILRQLEGDHYYKEWQRCSAQFSDLSLSQKLKSAKHMPEGSLGHAYYLHVTDGKPDNFTALSEYETNKSLDSFTAFKKRTLDIHDLIHVVMGYDKGRMGEACVIRASASAGLPYCWNAFIFLGVLRHFFVYGMHDGIWLWKACITEPKKRVENVRNWNDVRWEEMLDVPLHIVKKRLAIGPSPVYEKIVGYSHYIDKEWTN